MPTAADLKKIKAQAGEITAGALSETPPLSPEPQSIIDILTRKWQQSLQKPLNAERWQVETAFNQVDRDCTCVSRPPRPE